jgi:hypothetical protein
MRGMRMRLESCWMERGAFSRVASPPNSRLQPTETAPFGSVSCLGLVLARSSAAEALPRCTDWG